MGRNRMKSSPTGLCFPLGVMGRQDTQDEFTTKTELEIILNKNRKQLYKRQNRTAGIS